MLSCSVHSLSLKLNSAVVQSVKSEWKKRENRTNKQAKTIVKHNIQKPIKHNENVSFTVTNIWMDYCNTFSFALMCVCVYLCIRKSITINGKVFFADDGDCEWRWQSLMRKNDMMIITMASRYNVWIFSKKISCILFIFAM